MRAWLIERMRRYAGTKLAEENRRLREQITDLIRVAHERNRQLDAMHWVWCDGGCSSGVHRWDHGRLEWVHYYEAKRNVERMERWLKAKTARENFKAEVVREGR